MAYEEIIFPNNLRTIRLSRKLCMTELAKKAGLSLSAMSKMEKGVRRPNQKLLLLLCKLLNCRVSDIFVKETDEIASVWKDEMKKRLSANKDEGLKIFGAGIRYLRKNTGITIVEASKRAKMTLSVYHKIEVGQRGIFEQEVDPLAKAFGLTGQKMFDTISDLYKSGKLVGFIEKNEEKVKSVLVPSISSSGSNFSEAVFGAKIYDSVRKKLIPVFGKPDSSGTLSFIKSDERMISVPAALENRNSIYSVIPNPNQIGTVFPSHSYLFVDSDIVAAKGDLAIYLNEDFSKIDNGEKATANIVFVDVDAKGKLIGKTHKEILQIKNPSERLHKVIQIIME